MTSELIFWVTVSRIVDAMEVLSRAQDPYGTTWTQGATHRLASGAQVRAFRQRQAGGPYHPGDLRLRVIFTTARDAVLFKLAMAE